MKHKKTYLKYRIFCLIFSALVFSTMFMPTISLDKYVEYDFSNGYYNESYSSYIEPIATNISPYMFITNLFAKGKDYRTSDKKLTALQKELKNDIALGKITEEEYKNIVISSYENGTYYIRAIKFKTVPTLSRLSEKIFLFSCIITAFYAVSLITLIISTINILNKKRILSIANIYCGWILVCLMLLTQFFTFSFAISSQNIIESITKQTLTEEITYAATPKFLSIFLLFALVVYSIVASIMDRLEAKNERQNKEIPVYIAEKIASNKNQNKYRKIKSKKSKYKNGSKKKRHS